jgi:hypothetical protein
MNLSTKEIGQPEQETSNEQKADNQQVSPSIANAVLCEVHPKDKWEIVEEKLSSISTKYLMWELVNRLENDICETFRFIKELEAIKFSKEQCDVLRQVPAPNFTTDKNGRLINLYHIVSEKQGAKRLKSK